MMVLCLVHACLLMRCPFSLRAASRHFGPEYLHAFSLRISLRLHSSLISAPMCNRQLFAGASWTAWQSSTPMGNPSSPLFWVLSN